MSMNSSDEMPLFCHRCGAELTPGEGNFYVVKIEAVADPSPPIISEQDLEADIARQMDELIASMREMSERELLEQVYRRLTIFLCGVCYARWIEDPTG